MAKTTHRYWGLALNVLESLYRVSSEKLYTGASKPGDLVDSHFMHRAWKVLILTILAVIALTISSMLCLYLKDILGYVYNIIL